MVSAVCPHCASINRPGSRFCAFCGVALPAGLAGAPPGATLQGGRYRLVRALGRGGNGAVYLVEDTRLGRACVAKELHPPAGGRAERQRAEADFEREALILARLSTEHAGLPQTYDYFAEAGRYYLVMQYVAGEDLDARLHVAGPLTEAEAVAYGAAVADVLAFLHAQRPDPVVHRDVKPANLIVDGQGRVKLVDFGLAKALPSTTGRLGAGSRSQTGAAGTAGYTPVEQWALLAEARSDVYALGATLHHLVTGRDPCAAFRGQADLNLELIRRLSIFPPARSLRPELSPALDGLLAAMLAPEPESRPPAAEVQAVLGGLLKPGRSRVAPRAARPVPASKAEYTLAVPLLSRPALERAAAASLRAQVAGLPPDEPVTLLSARAVLLPCALATYTVAADFTDAAGRLLHAIRAEGTCLVDGAGGPAPDPRIGEALAGIRSGLATLALPLPDVQVMPFRLDARRLTDVLASQIVDRHTEPAEYYGANRRRYRRVCRPRRREITFEGGGALLFHHPRWSLRVGVRGREYGFDGYQGLTGRLGLLVPGAGFSGQAFCPGCGGIFPAAQMLPCATCGRRVCATCVVRRTRLGIFHKDFCTPACAGASAAHGSVLQWL